MEIDIMLGGIVAVITAVITWMTASSKLSAQERSEFQDDLEAHIARIEGKLVNLEVKITSLEAERDSLKAENLDLKRRIMELELLLN